MPYHALGARFAALVFTMAGVAALATPAPATPAPANGAPPAMAASAPAPFMHGQYKPKKAAPAQPVKRVDINSAGKAELKTLPGIGDAEADRIIANRPYLSKTQLVEKKVLPVGPYLSLKGRVVALQKNPPKPRTAKS